jgi:chemosensory pili system protein ChpA (sensor histidine kinase/response regulator)
MEELYRRVSDRQTMGSVVQELRASLTEAEKAIDQFFRNPEDHDVLVDVPVQLTAMRGVLSVLGMDHASQALLRMRDEVNGLVSTEVDPERIRSAGVFDRLAGNLSALGFLIDMLSVQPQMAKSLFTFNAASGTLAPVMGRTGSAEPVPAAPVEPRLIEQAQMLAFSSVRDDVPLQEVTRDLERLSHEAQAADQPALAAAVLKAQDAIGKAVDATSVASARGELSEALVDFVATATEPMGLAPVSAPTPLAPVKSISLVGELEHDDEMRDIFLEEAREVIESAQAAVAELQAAPSDLNLLTTLRRAFHTLKGSSRMVGLMPFGEAAWSGEQVFNTQLADQRPAEPPLIEFTQWMLAHLSTWVDDIAAHRDGHRSEGEVKIAADRLTRRLQAGAGSSDITLPLGLPDDLPSRDDLELRSLETEPDAPAEAVAFELDLSRFDAPALPGADAPLALTMPALPTGRRVHHVRPLRRRRPCTDRAGAARRILPGRRHVGAARPRPRRRHRAGAADPRDGRRRLARARAAPLRRPSCPTTSRRQPSRPSRPSTPPRASTSSSRRVPRLPTSRWCRPTSTSRW